jgi:hypothetical protein
MNIQRRMLTLLLETRGREWRNLSKDRRIIADAKHLPAVGDPEFSALKGWVPLSSRWRNGASSCLFVEPALAQHTVGESQWHWHK